MRKRFKMILIFLAAVVLVLCVAFIPTLVRRMGQEGPGKLFGSETDKTLTAFRYSSGGDMLGSSEVVTIKKQEDGTVYLGIEKLSWHGDIPACREYIVDGSLLTDIQSIMFRYGMQNWGSLPQSRDQILDGSTSTYRFTSATGSVRFSDTQELPSGAGTHLREIHSLIASYADDAKKLPGLVHPALSEEEIMDYYAIETGTLRMVPYSYIGNSLTVAILNGTEEDFPYHEAFLVCLDDGASVELEGFYGGTLSAGYRNMDASVEVKERLKAGTYRLTIGFLSCDFEIR